MWWPHVEELDRVLAPVLYEVYSRDASYMAASEALSVIQVSLATSAFLCMVPSCLPMYQVRALRIVRKRLLCMVPS